MRATCIQLALLDDESKPERVERVLGLISGAVEAASPDLVVLPELWPTGYFSFGEYAEHAETLDGPLVSALSESARKHKIHLMGGTFVERRAGALANCAIVIGPDGMLLHVYRKIHLFGYGSEEALLLTPGEDLAVVKTALGTMGTSTCYDLRFPELYRVLVSKGAELVVIPAAWPLTRVDHWRLLLRARAVENQIFVVACNGAGAQGGVELAGHSTIIDPWGRTLVEGGTAQDLVTADLDMAQVADIRKEFPVLDHRRIAVGEIIPQPGARPS